MRRQNEIRAPNFEQGMSVAGRFRSQHIEPRARDPQQRRRSRTDVDRPRRQGRRRRSIDAAWRNLLGERLLCGRHREKGAMVIERLDVHLENGAVVVRRPLARDLAFPVAAGVALQRE